MRHNISFRGTNLSERFFVKRSLTEVISESDFLALAQDHSQNFLKIYSFLIRTKSKNPCTRRFYAYLIEESEELETFLDDHSARDNKTWYFFVKLVACIRNIAKAAFVLKHILHRYPAYDLQGEEVDQFLKDAQRVSAYFAKTVLSLFESIRAQAHFLGISLPEAPLEEDIFGEVYPRKRLPYTIDEDEEEATDGRKAIANIASQYLSISKKFKDFRWDMGKKDLNNLQGIVPEKINEEKSREIMAHIHNLESTYDHHIRHSPLEFQDERLKTFRGYISMPLHLMSAVNWLTHLHQRHLKGARRDISHIIDDRKILDIAINFCLYYTGHYLQAGKQLALDLTRTYIEIGTCELKIPEKLGFHLRPATLVARVANYYGSNLALLVDGQEYDASSVLNLTMASGLIARKGVKIVLFKGDKRILHDLEILAQHNYGEDFDGNQVPLPSELSHLWN